MLKRYSDRFGKYLYLIFKFDSLRSISFTPNLETSKVTEKFVIVNCYDLSDEVRTPKSEVSSIDRPRINEDNETFFIYR